MQLWILVISLMQTLRCRSEHELTASPTEFRGLWSISRWDENRQNYSQQIGQAFFYNNGTFTLNLLDQMNFTWINHLVEVHKIDQEGTYHVLTVTTQGPEVYLNQTLCYWRRQTANGDILWGRQSNGTCTPTFELDQSAQSTRYTRHAFDYLYVDDENPLQILSNSPFERDLIRFDRSLHEQQEQGIVFYGSSSIRFWTTLQSDFANLKSPILNRGFGGSTLKQCSEQFKRLILPLNPRLLMLYAGENDIAENQTSAQIQVIFRQMISNIRRYFPSLPIVYLAIKPSPSRANYLLEQNQTNHWIKKEMENWNQLYYLDLFTPMLTSDNQLRRDLYQPDDLHLNEKGYALWTRTIQDFLRTNQLVSEGFSNSPSVIRLLFLCTFLFLFQAQ